MNLSVKYMGLWRRTMSQAQSLLVIGVLALLTLGAATGSVLPAALALVGNHAAGQHASQHHLLAADDPPII